MLLNSHEYQKKPRLREGSHLQAHLNRWRSTGVGRRRQSSSDEGGASLYILRRQMRRDERREITRKKPRKPIHLQARRSSPRSDEVRASLDLLRRQVRRLLQVRRLRRRQNPLCRTNRVPLNGWLGRLQKNEGGARHSGKYHHSLTWIDWLRIIPLTVSVPFFPSAVFFNFRIIVTISHHSYFCFFFVFFFF